MAWDMGDSGFGFGFGFGLGFGLGVEEEEGVGIGWMVVVEEWVCWVRGLGLGLGRGGWGVEGWESVSESSSQAMFSSGERAAPGGLLVWTI